MARKVTKQDVAEAQANGPAGGHAIPLASAVATAMASEATGFPPPAHMQAVIDAADPADVAAIRAEISAQAVTEDAGPEPEAAPPAADQSTAQEA